jgi:hypothetical protein
VVAFFDEHSVVVKNFFMKNSSLDTFLSEHLACFVVGWQILEIFCDG